MRNSQMRTPARLVRGLGAGRSGTRHFWHQRITSAAAVLLSIAFVIIIIALLGRGHAAVVRVLASPFVAIIMLLFVINSAYHMWIGMQEIILDYVHEEKRKLLCVTANIFFVAGMTFVSVFSILKLSFGV